MTTMPTSMLFKLMRGGTKGYKSVPFFKKLGNAYYFNAQLEQVKKNGMNYLLLTDKLESEYYRYAQSYELLEIMKKQIKFNHDDRAELTHHENYLQQIKANSGRYTIKDSG
jgi:hypothetical protein